MSGLAFCWILKVYDEFSLSQISRPSRDCSCEASQSVSFEKKKKKYRWNTGKENGSKQPIGGDNTDGSMGLVFLVLSASI